MPAECCGIITVDCLLVPGEAMLGAFAKLPKATVGFVVSVRPRGTLDGFARRLIFGEFLEKNICRDSSSSFEI
jgi:hypothetical protein